ncbi:trigger factor [Clostridia bacterium]|nr:trigger factor [Clostridia bacterium]
MSEVKVEKLEHSHVKLEIEVGREVFQKAVNEAYRRNAGRMNVPGFRRGKAPRGIIEKMYGEGVFYEDAVDIALPDAFRGAVEQADIEPFGKPDLDIVKLDADGFTFTAAVAVAPEITLKAYKGLSAEKKVAEVTDTDVDDEIERLRSRNARIETTESPIETTDTAVIDFEGFTDGVPFEGGKGTDHRLTIGSGQFIPGFEEQLVGHAAGEDVDVNVTFPEEYHSEELAGKAALFKVSVKEVKRTVKPELDDDFAQDVSEFDTLDELRGDVRKRLGEQRVVQADEAYESAIIDKMLEGFEGADEIPDEMIDDRLESIMQDFSYRLSMQGLEISRYLKMTGQTSQQLMEAHRDTAKRHVMTDLAFAFVAKSENMTVTEEELDAEYAKLSEAHKMGIEEIKAAIPVKALTHDLLSLKASEFVKANSVITEGE